MARNLDRFIAAGPDDQTDRIQAALDQGRADLGPGVHRARALRMISGTHLHLEAGAVLSFLPDYDAYARNVADVVAEDSDRAMILAQGASQVAITGTGEIRANGTQAFGAEMDREMGTRIPARHRPRVLVCDRCEDVRLSGFSVVDSPMWTMHLADCDGVAIHDIGVDNDLAMPNTDGLVLDGCRDVRAARLVISTADDGVVLKTSRRRDGGAVGPCEDIHVARARIESRSCALKLGTESYSDFRRITFEGCQITGSNRGMGIFSRDGGCFEQIAFRDIELACDEAPDGFWGSGEALTVTLRDRRQERPAGAIRQIVARGISGSMEGAINLVSDRPGGISDVRLQRLRLAQRPGTLGTGAQIDMRPGPEDLLPSDGVEGRTNAWRRDTQGYIIGLEPYPGGMPGIYARHVAGLDLEDVTIDRPETLPQGWNPEPVVIEPQ